MSERTDVEELGPAREMVEYIDRNLPIPPSIAEAVLAALRKQDVEALPGAAPRQTVVDTAEVRTLREQVERLRGENRLRKRIIERLPLCPDHRDKVRDRCAECSREAAEARADTLQRESEALRADRERLDWLGANGTAWVKGYGSTVGPIRQGIDVARAHVDPQTDHPAREAVEAARALDTKGGE